MYITYYVKSNNNRICVSFFDENFYKKWISKIWNSSTIGNSFKVYGLIKEKNYCFMSTVWRKQYIVQTAKFITSRGYSL